MVLHIYFINLFTMKINRTESTQNYYAVCNTQRLKDKIDIVDMITDTSASRETSCVKCKLNKITKK